MITHYLVSKAKIDNHIEMYKRQLETEQSVDRQNFLKGIISFLELFPIIAEKHDFQETSIDKDAEISTILFKYKEKPSVGEAAAYQKGFVNALKFLE